MKRLFDLIFSIICLILASPVLLLVTILIRLDSSGPILFCQERVGKDGKTFRIYKFRTMVEDADRIGPVITAQNDPRITQIGVLLRWLKIDELPQLFNVLKSEMSMVGPRPEVPKIVETYTEAQRKVLVVKPGIIGPSQISNRDEASMLTEKVDVEDFYRRNILPKKLERDLAYVMSKNPFRDLKIIFGGAAKVFLTSIKLRYIFESRRRIAFLFFDILISIATYWGAYALRFEGEIPAEEIASLKTALLLIVFFRVPCFIYFGLYQTLWQYLGIQEFWAILRAVTVGSLFLPVISLLLQTGFQPRSVLIIDWVLLVAALSGSRILFKVTADRLRQPQLGVGHNVLIIGADDTGELLVREFIKNPQLGYRAIGFLDNDLMNQGVRIHGVKVLGKVSQLQQVIRVKKVGEVVIALKEASREEIHEILARCRELNLPCRIVPPTSRLMPPHIIPLRLREVDVSDLLGRELVQADLNAIHAFLRGKKVLVTGAGGSIGSELARVIFQNAPEELILVDHTENNLYEVEMSLRGKSSAARVFYYLRNITHSEEMKAIFEKHKPDLVYHAAAYKHVPLMEANVKEAVINNVLGTRIVADLAAGCGTERFVLISTDKAICPSSVMGATKRIAELYVQNLENKKTHFLTVRFGNVFNSKGSVVPLFRKQIEEGGPITITDSNAKRYFMDLSEAVFLILQASILGSDSEIFVLDMGHPIRILDLARDLVQLMGVSPDKIPIQYIGLRPGEKLEEEIEFDGEKAQATSHKKIRIWKSVDPPPSDLAAHIDELIRYSQNMPEREGVLARLKKIVPDYRPSSS